MSPRYTVHMLAALGSALTSVAAAGPVQADEGALDILGDFKSHVFGIGPQMGYNLMAGDVPIYTNLRGYLEAEAENRPKGTSLFLTVNLPVSRLMTARQGGQ